MPMSIYYMNVVHDIVATYCELHEDDRVKFEEQEAHFKRILGQLPYGNNIKKAEKIGYTEAQKEADRWLSNHAWPPPAPFKSSIFPAKIWDWKKGAAAYAAHWRKEFLHSETNDDVKAAARAAARGHFVKLGKNEYIRLGVRELTELTIDDALKEKDEVADVNLVKPLVQPTMKNVTAEMRMELMGKIVARSCRAKAITGLLQDEVVSSRRAIVRQKAKFRMRKRGLKHELHTTINALRAAEADLAAVRQRAAALYDQMQQLKNIAPPAKLKKLDLADLGPEPDNDGDHVSEELEQSDSGEDADNGEPPELENAGTPPPGRRDVAEHEQSPAVTVPPVVKEEPIDEQFKLADLEKEIQTLAKRLSLLFRIENDVFVLMLPTEACGQWHSRLLMLRDDNSSIRLAEFTGSSEAFAEKAEHWLKSDFHGKQQLMKALDAKCVEYFQQQKMVKEEDD